MLGLGLLFNAAALVVFVVAITVSGNQWDLIITGWVFLVASVFFYIASDG